MRIEVGQSALSNFLYLFFIMKFTVYILEWLFRFITSWVAKWHKRSKQQWLLCNKVVPIFLVLVLDDSSNQRLEEVSILITDKSILEYSETFMSPKLNEVVFSCDGLCTRFRDSLEYLGDISKVIGVMTLSWCWSEVFHGLLVDEDSIGDNAILHALNWLREGWRSLGGKEPVKDGCENVLETSIRVRLDVENVEMSDVSRTD